MLLVFLITLVAFPKKEDKLTLKDDSKVLAKVNGANITQQQVDTLRKSSIFSEKEMIEKLINDELLLIKAKDLKIKVTDKEAKAETEKNRELIERAEDIEDVKATIEDIILKLGVTEEEYWDKYAIQSYKRLMTIGKTRQSLGADVDKVLKQLREEVKIEYYN